MNKADEQGEGEEELVSGGAEVNALGIGLKLEYTFLNYVLIWISLVYVHSFISNFIYLDSLSLFVISLAKSLSIFSKS